eukprot:358811-Chlamydomonas_euryale.AAC.8
MSRSRTNPGQDGMAVGVRRPRSGGGTRGGRPSLRRIRHCWIDTRGYICTVVREHTSRLIIVRTLRAV